MATRIAPSAMMPPTRARKPNAPTTYSESGITVVKMLKKLGQMRGTTTVMVPHDNHSLEWPTGPSDGCARTRVQNSDTTRSICASVTGMRGGSVTP